MKMNNITLTVRDRVYRVGKHLGSGAFGTTFLAIGPDNKKVALKLLFPFPDAKLSFDNEERFVKYMEKVIGCKKHMLCYSFSDVLEPRSRDYKKAYGLIEEVVEKLRKEEWEEGKKDPYPISPKYPIGVLVTTFIEGHSVGSLLEDPNVSFVDEALEAFAKQMIDSLVTLHSNRIYHRDIKPDNIMVQNVHDTQEVSFVLIDFGLSCFISSSDNTCTSIVGSPYFRSPEANEIKLRYKQDENYRYEGDLSEVIRASDIFSLGMSMYEMKFNRNPDPFEERRGIKILSSYKRLPNNTAVNRIINYIFDNYNKMTTENIKDYIYRQLRP